MKKLLLLAALTASLSFAQLEVQVKNTAPTGSSTAVVGSVMSNFPIDLSGAARPGAAFEYLVNSGGNNSEAAFFCGASAPINVSGTTATQIVALTANKVIRVCHMSFDLGGTSPTLTIQQATASSCGGTVTSLSGAYTAGKTLDLGPGSALRLANATALCLVLGGTSPTATGIVIYAQY